MVRTVPNRLHYQLMPNPSDRLTRISMVLTIARILPLVQNRLKFLVRGIAVGFVLIWVLVIGYQMGLCISDEAWHHSPAMVCSAVGWIIGVVSE